MEDKLEWRDKEEIDLMEMTEQLAKRIKSNHTLFLGFQKSLLEELRSTCLGWRAAYEKMKAGKRSLILDPHTLFDYKMRIKEWKSDLNKYVKSDAPNANMRFLSRLSECLNNILALYANPDKAIYQCEYRRFETICEDSNMVAKGLFFFKCEVNKLTTSPLYSKQLYRDISRLKSLIFAQGLTQKCLKSKSLNEIEIGSFLLQNRINSGKDFNPNGYPALYLLLQKWLYLAQKLYAMDHYLFPLAVEAKEEPLFHDVPASEETQTSAPLPPAPAERDKPFQAPEEANCLAGAVLRDETVFQAFVERLREAAGMIYQRSNKRMTAWKWCFLLYALRELQLIDEETSHKAFGVMVAALVPQPDMTAEQQANNIKSNVQYHNAKPDTANNARNQKLIMSIKAHFQPVADMIKSSGH